MAIRIRARLAAPLAAALKTAQRVTFVAGAALLAWVCYVTLDSAYTQWSGSRALAAERHEEQENIVPRTRAAPARGSSAARGAVLGNFAMPRLGLSFVLLEGTDTRTLDRSIGRVEDSGPVGGTGNIGIAGHRNTHFRKLEWARRGDEIVLTSHNVEYKYLVEWVRLFKPTDLEVLDASNGPAVTLITCFPFEYVGSAPLRFIVRALPDEATRAKLMADSPQTAAKR
jgi:sortase A